MKKMNHFQPASKLNAVKYEIRGALDQRAQDLEKQGHDIIKLNIGNPAAFGFRAPETMLKAVIEMRVAAEHRLIVFSDEIYDRILYDGARHTPTAALCHETLCVTFNGLSKVYRAAGLRTGWVFLSGDRREATPFLKALELLSSLRLCPNVPGQWAVQTALGGVQSIYDLTAPSGRLGQQRLALLRAVEASSFLSHANPMGALYSFIKIDTGLLPNFNDREFAMRLLEEKKVLVVPGSSFNWPEANYFRVTFLPDASVIDEVFGRIDSLLSSMAKTPGKRKTVA